MRMRLVDSGNTHMCTQKVDPRTQHTYRSCPSTEADFVLDHGWHRARVRARRRDH